MTPPGTDPTEVVTTQFLDHRELLFSVVYNMLGSVADTEDVLQEVWLAWSARHRGSEAAPIDNPRAYLIRIASNKALARRTDLSRRREVYVGPWLPEPLLTDNDHAAESADRAQSLSTAVLVVLETLSPLERAVFVLHELFGFSHAEVARLLDRTPEAVRQLATRARKHVRARRPRYRADPRVGAEVAERFAAAALGGDLPGLLELLAPDVTLMTDSGGKGPAYSMEPVLGRADVAAALLAITANRPGDMSIRYRSVAGDPCALVFSGESPLAAVVLDLTVDGHRIAGIYSVTNPDKMSGIR
ncbi:sigma-70 family RNA polymerase sigma factor [Nocardia bovistercoris]|uniref:Sigma-70 family RNA polymerase sigma factor n=1 Tax=Nocardia bovistercoris TaxID=2785916 RepID=A0A931IHJ2_9NOCA|nr:sigma-70 family RNA polymerase sigma factor [Nocardia bovistercoris]MBH0780495.1 sigma-70 family RNA polymerase sigma factor [Nocardia bovistercoris]